LPKAKQSGVGQSKVKAAPKKPGPYVTRIPVVSETNHCEPQTTSAPNMSAQQQHQQHVPQPQPEPPQQQLNPIEFINTILSDVEILDKYVKEFEGNNEDKRYRYLDEMLTRCIIKLDSIETEGKEDVRKARKEAIIAVHKCITDLEAKVKANTSAQRMAANQQNTSTDETMQTETDSGQVMQTQQIQFADSEPMEDSSQAMQTEDNTNKHRLSINVNTNEINNQITPNNNNGTNGDNKTEQTNGQTNGQTNATPKMETEV